MPVHGGANRLSNMNILEFIRRNSLLVIIVIGVVGLGLVMMDYSGKGSMLSRDFYIRANNVNYSYIDTMNLGKNAEQYLQSMHSASTSKLVARFDKDEDGKLNEAEMSTLNAWIQAHPEQNRYLRELERAYQTWSYGFTQESDVNIAINRIILKETANELGIKPSKEQIDAYIKSLPAFTLPDGGFDHEFYQRLIGVHDGITNNAQERGFREVIADLITLRCVEQLLTEGLRYNGKANLHTVNAQCQRISGKYARLTAAQVPPPATPTEDEIKAYWDLHKDRYKSEERRIVSIYTLTPGEGVATQDLLYTSENIMESLAQANGRGLDQMLADAVENPENAAFTYEVEGKSCTTFPLSSLSSLPEGLQQEIDYKGNTASLGQIAFTEIADAPTVDVYEQDAQAGHPDAHNTFQQIRGFFPTHDGKLVLIRVNAIEAPAILLYEEAKDRALADLKNERTEHALEEAASKLYADMEAALSAEGLAAAFNKAEEAGAHIESFGPLGLGLDTVVPEGLNMIQLAGVPSGKLAPLKIEGDTATISAVTGRTIEDSPDMAAFKNFQLLPQKNVELRMRIFLDWLHTSYERYQIQLSDQIKLNH